GARSGMVGFAENITGLHKGKVAFVTGGSAGIGGQVARLLALAGAKVMMVARRESALEAARERIVGELKDIGFSGVDRRVKILPDVDVSDFDSLRQAIHKTIQIFGRIDYLINNAGVAGAEDMVVDMSPEDWQFTLDANLNSNYLLTHEVVPLMRAQGSGYVLNVSSYFGGEKLLAVAYPNRADYAVSKAGQRSMVENFSRALGPEIQCNAIAPGPVDGDRLSGTGGKPGLFQRRARLILENKRLNAVYAAVIHSVRGGAEIARTLSRLAQNTTATLSHDSNAPDPLRALALDLARQGDGVCSWDQFLVTEPIAASLLLRLSLGGYLIYAPEWQKQAKDPSKAGKWLRLVPPDDSPFLPQGQITATADRVGRGVLSQLHLGKMPTEEDVAQATVFYLADRAVSGETFMPSGGLQVERSYTEREMFGSPKQKRLDQMKGKTVWMIGEHLSDYLSATANALIQNIGVSRVVIFTQTKDGADAITSKLDKSVLANCESIIAKGEIEAEMDKALQAWGSPTTVVSSPFAALPERLFDADAPLTPDEFRTVVDQNLTHHFRVARKASLYDRSQLVLVSPDVPVGSAPSAFSLANFIKTTLHAFTSTLAVENERLVHDVAINQINLTRRVRSEEPRDEAEHREELNRFTRAVLLVGAPLPDAQDSRYRAKIYRGTSMTV
ncbi:MAG: SDR family oxidoreductase, partial [Pseudomonadota bacterium]